MRLWMLDEDARVQDVLRWCVEQRGADRLVLISRVDTDLPGRQLFAPRVEASVSSIFGPAVLRTPWVSAWPITELVDHVAKAYVIRLDERVAVVAGDMQPLLFQWSPANEPPLPEDLCVYRAGESLPILVTRTHTRDAWIFESGEVDLPRVEEIPWDDEILDYVPSAPDFLRLAHMKQ